MSQNRYSFCTCTVFTQPSGKKSRNAFSTRVALAECEACVVLLLRDTNIVSSLPLMMINNNDFPLPSIRDRQEVGAEGILKENYIIMYIVPPHSLTKAISRVLLPISLSTWWSSRLSCSLETTAVLAPPAGHLGCCWAAAWLWPGCTGCPANAPASLCSIKELPAACYDRKTGSEECALWTFLAIIRRNTALNLISVL